MVTGLRIYGRVTARIGNFKRLAILNICGDAIAGAIADG
jgi:hypothetical protein